MAKKKAIEKKQQALRGTNGDSKTLQPLVVQPRQEYTASKGRRYCKPVYNGNPRAKTKPCTRCGKGVHPRDKCPAKDATCHRCHKMGHYSSQCFTKKISKVANESYLEETAFLDTVLSNDTSAWFASIDLNECKTAFKLDIGAEVTAISKITHQSQFAIPENG